MVYTFNLNFTLNKALDDSCYTDSRCYKEIMVELDEDNIYKSIACSIAMPVCLPIDIYLANKYIK